MTTSSASRAATAPAIRSAQPSDLDAVEHLLKSADLPVDGVSEAFDNFVVAEATDAVVGVAGLEIHGSDGILRSVAVDTGQRGRGLGRLLTERVLQHARELGLRRLYLLTTMAEAYFPRYGFRRIAREDVSAEVQGSIEFREACPASAVAMVLDLTDARA